MSVSRLSFSVLTLFLFITSLCYGATGVYHTATAVPPDYTFGVQDTNWVDGTLVKVMPNTPLGDNILTELGTNSRITVFFSDFHDDYPHILMAKLYLYLVGCDTRTSLTWNAYLLVNFWDEADVTWSNRTASVPWDTAGGDYSPTPSTNGTVVCTDEEYHEFDITSLLAEWTANWNAYMGVLITSDDPLAASALYITKDNTTNDVNQQPYLVVTPEPEMILLILSASLLLLRNRQALRCY